MGKNNKFLIPVIVISVILVFSVFVFRINSRNDVPEYAEEIEDATSLSTSSEEEKQEGSEENESLPEATEVSEKDEACELPATKTKEEAENIEDQTSEALPLESIAPSNEADVISGETRDFWTIREDMVKNVQEFKKINPDTVGWLYLWDTTVDSPVFQRAGDNDYYLKHNDYKQEDKNGALVSDFNNILTGRDTQSKNIVIYGHSKDEDPDGGVEISREFEHFTELKRWQKIDFCRSHPYFLFATEDESEVFEVFAAFHTKTEFAYNIANPTKEQQRAILEEAKKKSLFDFHVDVNENDRIMTLSTCCRRIVPTYPNGYRFVIMGRLVEKGKLLDYDRKVEVNPTALTKTNIYD